MSGLFIAMFVGRRGSRGQSLVIAGAKWIGTLAPHDPFRGLRERVLHPEPGPAVQYLRPRLHRTAPLGQAATGSTQPASALNLGCHRAHIPRKTQCSVPRLAKIWRNQPARYPNQGALPLLPIIGSILSYMGIDQDTGKKE